MTDAGNRPPKVCLILSSGRCGSTLLTNIVHAHPAALSISELFSSLRENDLGERELSGAEFWRMLSVPSLTDVTIGHLRIKLDEMLYPAFDPHPYANRFSLVTGIPPLLQVTLPHLTDRPDDLYESLEKRTANQPPRLLSEHLLWLFQVLAGNQRPAVVVERSGGSIAYAPALLRLFPDARVVHVFRDGRECAVSMSRHARYKFAAIRAALQSELGYDPYLAPDLSEGDVRRLSAAADARLAGLTPRSITRARYDRYDVQLSRYGAMWSRMIVSGIAILPEPGRILNLDYRDLVTHPRESIGSFLDFLGLERNREREERMATLIRPARDVRGEVSARQWEMLTNACHLGMNRIYGRGKWQ